MDKSTLPSRLRESTFRRFETTIAAIVERYPAVTYVDRGNMSSITVAARLRDAMLSLERFDWPTSLIDVAKFKANREDIRVSHQETTVVAGSTAAIAALSKTTPICDILPLDLIEEPTSTLKISSLEGILICRLASMGAFARPVAVSGIEDKDVEFYEENFDVRVDKKEGGVYYIS